MIFSERYNKIIHLIERTVIESPELTAIEQLRRISPEVGFPETNLRDFNAVFSFITDCLPLDYIKQRRLMYAYKILIGQESFNVNDVLQIAGYDNQNSFGKKFKEVFNKSPLKAWKEKDMSIIREPLYWHEAESLHIDQKPADNNTVNENHMLGFDMATYNKFVEFQNYCSTYGVMKEQGEAAYIIAEKYHLELPKAFEYIKQFEYVTKEIYAKNGYEYYYGEPDEGEVPITVEEFDPKAYYLKLVDDKDMVYCCTQRGLSADEADDALFKLEYAAKTYNPEEYSTEFLYACAHSDCVTYYLEKATNYYLANSKDDFLDFERFDVFLDELDSRVPIEEAFEIAMEHITELILPT